MSKESRIIGLTEDLIKIPSVSVNADQLDKMRKELGVDSPEVLEKEQFIENSRETLELVSRYLNDVPFVDFEFSGIPSRLWGDPETMMNPTLLLNGHMDVVATESESMYAPTVSEGKMFGRGSADMKGPNAAMIESYRRWVEDNGSRGVGLLLNTDEEVGGFYGARAVIKEGLVPRVVFIPDGVSDGKSSFDVVKSQKAPHHFTVRVVSETKGGHASRAFKKDNPINRLMSFYGEVRDLEINGRKLSEATEQDPWKSTFEMTVMRSNHDSKNKIPEMVEAKFSWRWPLELIDFAEGAEKIRDVMTKHGVENQIDEEEGGGEGLYIDPNSDFVTTWTTVVDDVVDKEVGFDISHGSSDGRHFQAEGVDRVLLTSPLSGGAHAENEWVDIQSLVDLSEAVYQYQKKLLKNK